MGKGNSNDNTQFINRYNQAGLSLLQRTIIAKPGETGCKAGQYDKYPAFPVDILYENMLFLKQHDPQAMTNTTIVRIAVPKFDSIPCIPILPSIAVSAAKTADKAA
jgi:hypothetical protein